MAQHLMKFFNFLTPAHQQVLAQSNFLALKHRFTFPMEDGSQEEVILGITQNYLLLLHTSSGTEISYFCPLSFNLKFEVIRKQWIDDKTPGTPIGLKFDQSNPNQFLEFYNPAEETVRVWAEHLQKKINQRNFHKLFKAKKKIGKGAFATVYLAQRLIDKKMIAVKAFSKQKQFSGEKGKQSLENEIKIMRNIEHENISKLLEVYETDNSIYVILECLEGKQLNEEIKGGRKFTLEESKTILQQLLRGLAHLASKRIIHRDLKPENIMFKNKEGLEITICDFGLATYADEQKYLFVRCGTPGFVAPQIINLKDMSAKSEPISDVFSAGVIAHYLLLGHSIFAGKKYNQVLAENRACDFDFKNLKYKELPANYFNLLTSMLEKNPKKRINAEEALKLPIFCDEMEEQISVKKPFMNIGNSPKSKMEGLKKGSTYSNNPQYTFNNFSGMMEENIPPLNQTGFNIGQSVKGKMPYLGQQQQNPSFIMNIILGQRSFLNNR